MNLNHIKIAILLPVFILAVNVIAEFAGSSKQHAPNSVALEQVRVK